MKQKAREVSQNNHTIAPMCVQIHIFQVIKGKEKKQIIFLYISIVVFLCYTTAGAIFTMTEMNNERNTNFFQNSPFDIQLTYSSKFSFTWSTSESSLLIWGEAAHNISFNALHILKSYQWDKFSV